MSHLLGDLEQVTRSIKMGRVKGPIGEKGVPLSLVVSQCVDEWSRGYKKLAKTNPEAMVYLAYLHFTSEQGFGKIEYSLDKGVDVLFQALKLNNETAHTLLKQLKQHEEDKYIKVMEKLELLKKQQVIKDQQTTGPIIDVHQDVNQMSNAFSKISLLAKQYKEKQQQQDEQNNTIKDEFYEEINDAKRKIKKIEKVTIQVQTEESDITTIPQHYAISNTEMDKKLNEIQLSDISDSD